jgi:hypothetical protein
MFDPGEALPLPHTFAPPAGQLNAMRRGGWRLRRCDVDGLPEPLLTEDDAAKELRVSGRTLERYRARGTGPVFVKLLRGKSGRIRYRRADLEAWLNAHRQRSTKALPHDSSAPPITEPSNQ